MSVEEIQRERLTNDRGDPPSELPPTGCDDDGDDEGYPESEEDEGKIRNRLATASLILGVYLFFRFAGIFHYDCTKCDDEASNQYYSHRTHRTACRAYCEVDTDGDGYLSRAEFWRQFKAAASGGQVSENVFASKWTRVTTMCHHEALGAFDSIAAIGSTSDVIDVTSFNDAFDVLCRWTFCNESRGILESAFPTAWNHFYDLIEDEDNCMFG